MQFFILGLVLILFIGIFIPLLPASYVYDVDFYFDQYGNKINRRKATILQFLLQQLIILLQQFVVGIAVSLALRGTVSILIFLVVGTDLYFRKSLSIESLTITIVGVIALYFDHLVTNAKRITFMGIFKYESK